MGEHDGHRKRLRQRFLRNGLSGFEDHNILELLLFYAQPRRDTNTIAHRLMDTFGTLDAVFEAEPEALMAVDGVGESAAVLIHLVPEAARRYLMAKETPGTLLRSTEEIGKFLLPRFLNARSEAVYLISLDAKRRVTDCRLIGAGGPTSVSFDTRRIVETLMTHNAAGAILAHNHPNGFAIPSAEDRAATLRLKDVLGAVNIELVDHIVVAGSDFVSMAESGMMV